MTYEIQGWFDLRLSPGDDDENDLGEEELRAAVDALVPLARDLSEGRPAIRADVRWVNGVPVFDVTCFLNRRNTDVAKLDSLLGVVNTTLPGSFGILYEWSDDRVDLPSVDEYSVRVMARGTMTRRTDPFLSPIIPVVEDDVRP